MKNLSMTKIGKDKIAYAKFPILETKGQLSPEERHTFGFLMTSKEADWAKYIENYIYFVNKATS
jgi:hypothetical protein